MTGALSALPLTLSVPMGAVTGLVLGSFIATLVLRWGAGQAVTGRSCCDDCGVTLGWMDLVPLLGWLRARGRCRHCGAAIHPLHLRVELGAAAIGAVAVVLMPGGAGWLLALMGWILLPLALLDARYFWLPDRLVAPLALVGLIFAGPMLGNDIIARLAGATIGGVTLALLRIGFARARGREGMGEGDPKFAAALGAWLGWMPLSLMFLIASAGGILWAIATQKKDAPIADRHIPFGTFMAAAAWCAVPLWHYING